MKVVIRTVIVQHYCYYRCTTTAVLLPLYYYRCTTTAVLLPLYQYGQKLGTIHGAKHYLNQHFLYIAQSWYRRKKRKKKEKKKKVPHNPKKIIVSTLKIKLHPHTWVCAQHIHRHIHTDMPLKQTLGS